jgi:hypothetical protein
MEPSKKLRGVAASPVYESSLALDASIARLAAAHSNLEAMIVLAERDHDQVERIIKLCELHRVRWRVMPRVAQSMALTVEMVGAIPLIGPLKGWSK